MTSSDSPPPVPFGRYLLRSLIAEGGMAEVFVAEQRGAHDVSKVVAVKRTLPNLSNQPAFVSMFLDEARMSARLSHPNIVQVYDFGEVEGRYFLAMELLAGEELSAVIRKARDTKSPVPVNVAVAIMAGVCDGLQYAHDLAEDGVSLNLVHRDISPSNIMVTYQGGIKVLDFGIARAVDRSQEKTAAGVIKGKTPYLSPEQVQGLELDRRSDLFALGAVFYELLTGVRLFSRDNEFHTFTAILKEPAPDVCQVRADVPKGPKGIDAILQRLLAKDRDQRYPNARAVRQDLEGMMQGAPPRLDDYLVKLFGEQRMSTRTRMLTSTSRGGPISALSTSSRALTTSNEDGSTRVTGVPASVRTAPPTLAPTSPGTLSDAAVLAGLPKPRASWWKLAALGGALAAALFGAAWALATLKSTQAPAPSAATLSVAQAARSAAEFPEAPRLASVQVDTDPPGAQVSLGGKAAPPGTPARFVDLTPGMYEIGAVRPGFKAATQKVELKAGESRSVLVTLAADVGHLEVDISSAARVEVDGVDRGAERAFDLAPGEHVVQVKQPGFQPFEQRVTVQAGLPLTVAPHLLAVARLPPGKLDVSCIPWCRILLDGHDTGRTSPVVGLDLSAGKHRLRLEHPPSGQSKELVLSVKPGAALREVVSFR